MLVRPLSPIESVVHADQDRGLGRFDVEGTDDAARCNGGVQCPISRAEVHVVAFQKCRPLRGEHPFDATADGPTCSGLGGLPNLNTTKGEVCTGMTPSRAALEVEQPGGSKRIAEPGCQGVEPLIIEVGNNWPVQRSSNVRLLSLLVQSNMLRKPITQPPAN